MRFSIFWAALGALALATSLHAQDSPTAKMLDRARRAVFQLKVKGENHEVFATGTGFLVTEDGFAITNYHVVQGSLSASAEFVDEKTASVELWSALPQFDLALVKVDLSDPALRQGIAWFSLASDVPQQGIDVWAFGYPQGLGYSVTKGIVNGVRDYAKLPDELRAGLKYDPASRWVQTDCTINSGNSGGPLVTDDGAVIGINTWIWTKGFNLFFALSAVHAHDLLSTTPATPLTFKGALKAFGETAVARSTMPGLSIKPVPARLVRTALINFRKVIECSQCGGSGKINETVTTGHHTARGWRNPHVTNRTSNCPSCKGKRLAKPENIQRSGAKLIQQLAALDMDDSEAKTTLAAVEEALRAPFSCCAGTLQTVIGDDARQAFSASVPEVGKPVMFIGALVSDKKLSGFDGRFRIVSLGQANMLVILIEPRIANALEANVVFAGGLLAGYLDSSNGAVVPIVQNGFVVGK